MTIQLQKNNNFQIHNSNNNEICSLLNLLQSYSKIYNLIKT